MNRKILLKVEHYLLPNLAGSISLVQLFFTNINCDKKFFYLIKRF